MLYVGNRAKAVRLLRRGGMQNRMRLMRGVGGRKRLRVEREKNRHAKFNLAKIKRLICGIPHLVMKNRVAVSYGRLLLRRMGKWPPRRMAAICRKL